MKKSKYLKFIAVLMFSFFTVLVIGQTTEPGDPGGEPTLGDPPLGGGAPIGSGVILLLTLVAAYGGKKVFELRTTKMKSESRNP